MKQTIDLSRVLRERTPRYGGDLRKRTDIKNKDQYPTPPHHHHSRCTRAYAWETLRALGFRDMDRVLNKHGVARVMGAVEYVKVCPGIRNHGANVRLLLDSGDPIPLPPPARRNNGPLSGKYRDLVQH